MGLEDLASVMALEVSAYSHPWTRGNFADSLAAGYLSEIRLDGEGRLLGYWVAVPGADEMHLLNLTVAPDVQRQGHGGALLERLLKVAERRGDQMMWLEVRPSNLAARALYRLAGFAEVGLRRGYYPADRGREDALVLRLALPRLDAPREGSGDALD
jgi:ribosomal-protein-alanine N-acetyltransferase